MWDTAHMATAEAVAALEPKLLLGAEVAARTALGLGPHYSGKVQKWGHVRSGHNGTVSSSQTAGLGGKSDTGWHTHFPPQRPQPPAPETLTRAEGSLVHMGRLNPGSLGSIPLPSASPCHLPTSGAGLPSYLLEHQRLQP